MNDYRISSPPTKGCKAFNSSRAFMSTGIPSENLSIPSFMALLMSACSTAATVALMMGTNGAALFWTVAIVSPKFQRQFTVEKKGNPWAEDVPMASSSRLVFAILGSSLTASHASANLSGTGPVAGVTSARDRLSRETLDETGRGIGTGISHDPPTDA
jgi:hypothetical protein